MRKQRLFHFRHFKFNTFQIFPILVIQPLATKINLKVLVFAKILSFEYLAKKEIEIFLTDLEKETFSSKLSKETGKKLKDFF